MATLAAERIAELNRVGLRTALERLTLTQTRLRFAKGTPLDVDRAVAKASQFLRWYVNTKFEHNRALMETLGDVVAGFDRPGLANRR